MSAPLLEQLTTQGLGRGTRFKRALKMALAEMNVQEVSTRSVAGITKQSCGFAVTPVGQIGAQAKRYYRGG